MNKRRIRDFTGYKRELIEVCFYPVFKAKIGSFKISLALGLSFGSLDKSFITNDFNSLEYSSI